MTRLALRLTALAVLGSAAWVYYDCHHDAPCHVVYCGGKRVPCGLSRQQP